ncbi:MAG: ABC transporter ATP-binding protein, partial [Sulfolobales archaeon]
DIAEGECIAVVGPNGSGKTALLKTLSGFLKPISGSFNVMGVDLHRSKISVRRGLVFYVSQHPDYMFFSRTVEGELKHIHRSSSINEILSKSTWIQRHLKSSPYRLSMGQKRWLSIAISMAYSPKILMLDEPTVGLDYSMYRDLISLLDSLRKRGLAIIIATHDPRLIADLCDRALLISGGTLVEKDPVELALELERIAGVSL